MSREDSVIDALVQTARRGAAPEVSRADDAALVTSALARREMLGAKRTWRMPVLAAAAVIAIAIGGSAFAVLAYPDSAPVARDEADMRVRTTRAGDQLIVAGDAAFDVLEDGTVRRVRVREGEVLFDVPHLDPHSAFNVVTTDARVVVRGTIFSVRVAGGETSVRVYEGRVEVHRAAEMRVLDAGQRFGADASSRVLRDEGRRRAEQRATHSTTVMAEIEGPSTPSVAVAREVSPPRRAVSTEPPAPTLDEARRWLIEGDAERALAAANTAHGERAGFAWLRADALRALGRHEEAADVLESLADELGGAEAARAGLVAASIHLRSLHDPGGALAAIERHGCAADPALAERASALRVRALLAADRHAEASLEARSYLERFPTGGARTDMERLAR